MCLAIPGKVLSIRGDDPLSRMGKVSFGGVAKDVCLAYVPEARVGQYVIVHVGFAISLLDEDEAARTLAALKDVGAWNEALDELQSSPAADGAKGSP